MSIEEALGYTYPFKPVANTPIPSLEPYLRTVFYTQHLKPCSKRSWVGLLNPAAGRGRPRRMVEVLNLPPSFRFVLRQDGAEGLYKAAKLSEGELDVMRLKQQGFTQEQIASMTGRPMGTIKSGLYRGYAKIRKACIQI
jgi:predicted DNA-binding protein (UPF0251 family)